MAVDRDAAQPRGTGSTARSRMCAVAAGFREAVVVEGDALIFIEEEDDQFADSGGVDDLLDLVLALLVVDGLGCRWSWSSAGGSHPRSTRRRGPLGRPRNRPNRRSVSRHRILSQRRHQK